MRRMCFTAGCSLLLLLGSAYAQEIPKTVFSEWKSKVDPAVERGLQFLAQSQERNGSFPENYGTSTGIPSLVGMAFLSKGHMPTEGPYAANINRCIDYVLQHQQRTGLFVAGHAGSGPMYAHNITTLFLSEVSGMVDPERQKRIKGALARALQLILRAQRVPKSEKNQGCLLYTSPSPRDATLSRMPSSA